jgi:hypothetical protein
LESSGVYLWPWLSLLYEFNENSQSHFSHWNSSDF